MSLRLLFVLLCVAGTASALGDMSPRKVFCTQCKSVEDTVHSVLEMSVTYSERYFQLLKQTCALFPGVSKQPCDSAFGFYEQGVTGTIRAAEQRPCEVLYLCKPYEMNAGLDALTTNPEGFCRVCTGAVTYVLKSLGLETVLQQGADVAVEVCKQLGIVSEKDCVSSVKQLMKQIEMPEPSEICASVGLCNAGMPFHIET